MNSAPPPTSPPQSAEEPIGSAQGNAGEPAGESTGHAAGHPAGPRVTRDQVRDLSRLRRPRQGRMVAGVAEGLSRHLDIDPLLIRVIFGALTVFGGAGIVLYLLAWLTIPNEDAYDSPASRMLRQDPERVRTVGLTLAGIAGAITLLSAIGFATPRPFAVITLSVVALVLFTVFSRRGGHPTAQPAASPSRAAPPDDTAARPHEARSSSAPSDPHSGPGTSTEAPTTPIPPYAADPPTTVAEPSPAPKAWWQRGDSGPGFTPPGTTGTSTPPPGRPPRPPKPKSRLTAITLAVMALALGGIWFADAAGADVHPSVYPGTVLALTAAALLVGTWFGRAKVLILVGFLAALLTAATVVVGPGPYGEREYEPTSAASVKDTYEHGAGRVALNLDRVSDLQALDGRTIHVESHVGLVQVVVPTSLDAQVTSHVDAGEIDGPAVTQDEGDGEQSAIMTARHDGRPLVTIDVDLTFGKIEILRFDCPQLAIAQAGDVREQDLSTLTWKGDVRDPAACH